MSDDTTSKQPTLVELVKLLEDQESDLTETHRALVQIATNSRAKAQRRRREIERMMYFGYADYDILASFVLDADKRFLLSEMETGRGAATLQKEVAEIRKEREKDEVATALRDLDRVYAEYQEVTLRDLPKIEQQHKRPILETLISLARERARMRGAIKDPVGRPPQPRRGTHATPTRAKSEAAEDEAEFNPFNIMRGYEVDEAAKNS